VEESVITASDIPEGGWDPTPRTTARNRRISRRALGFLVEILSYPSGWHITVDTLAAQGCEGRDAIRKALRELEDAGYLIHLKYRGARGQWLTASFAGNTPEVARRLADDWLARQAAPTTEKPRSDRGTCFQPSANQQSENQPIYIETERETENRETENEITFGEDCDWSQPQQDPAIAEDQDPAVAEAPAAPTAFHSGMQQPEQSKIPAQRSYGSNRQRDDDWRAQLAAADPDDLYIALDCYRNARGGLEDWAYRTAASDLGIDLDPDDEIPESPDDDWTRLAYHYLLKKHDANPGDWSILQGLLDPLDGDIKALRQPQQRLEKVETPAGMSSEEFADQMQSEIMRMDLAEIGPYIAEFRNARPGVWHESRQEALKQLRARKEKTTTQAMNYTALRIAIKRYVRRGSWEMPLVPPSMRSQWAPSTSEPPPWAP
jgi:hypothetical protein